MAEREPRQDVVITHPNREGAAAKATRFVVILLILVSVGLLAIITIGGWDALEGAQIVQIAYPILYLLMAYYVARWNRGVLPVIAALAIILAIFAAVAGPAWFERDKSGFTSPALPEDMLGLVTLLLVPVQALLIAFAMRGFTQAWNVEVEAPADRAPGGRPATA